VTFDALEGICTLNIENALLTDAGTYVCLEQYSTVHAIRFQLIAGDTFNAHTHTIYSVVLILTFFNLQALQALGLYHTFLKSK